MTECDVIDESAYGTKFIKTMKLNNYVGNIDACYLYFGAAYWDKGLMDKLQQMVNEYKSLIDAFPAMKRERKIAIYRKLCKLESNWFVIHDPARTDSEIEAMKSVDSIYNYVDFIVPSGLRFHVSDDHSEPEGYTHVGGGVSTRKTRKTKITHI